MSQKDDSAIPRADSPPACDEGNSPPARLWTPWRMRYVAGTAREEGCIFCNRLADDNDARTLLLHRGEHAYVIMNLFPYNTGHVMIVPNAHIASPEDADEATSAALGRLRRPILAALRRALSPAGFNLGLNIGDVAGAGVTEHLHEHVVPRWLGDANFMPILASTMVMPELIAVTYAKIRAELQYAAHPRQPMVNVVISKDQQRVLADGAGRLPRVHVPASEPVWRAAQLDAQARGAEDVELLTWAGDSRADKGQIALLHEASFGNDVSGSTRQVIVAIAALDPMDRAIVETALARLEQSA